MTSNVLFYSCMKMVDGTDGLPAPFSCGDCWPLGASLSVSPSTQGHYFFLASFLSQGSFFPFFSSLLQFCSFNHMVHKIVATAPFVDSSKCAIWLKLSSIWRGKEKEGTPSVCPFVCGLRFDLLSMAVVFSLFPCTNMISLLPRLK